MRLLSCLLVLSWIAPASAVEVGVSGPSVWKGDADGAVNLAQKISATGATWTRVNFRLDVWTAPDDQTPRGPQQLTWFQAYDRIIDYLTTHGVRVYGEIGGESVPGGVRSAADANHYADAFVKIVDHFKNRVRVYETFNEPNNWKAGTQTPALSATDLAQIQQTIYLAAKWNGRQSDPCNKVTIVMAPILACCGGNGADYLSQYYKAGHSQFAFDWMRANVGTYPADGFGYHPYLNPADMQPALNAFWQVIATEEGADTPKQVWASEFGSALASATTQAQQAQYLSDAYDALAGFPHLAAGLWFTFQLYAGYGLIDGNGNPMADYSRFVTASNKYTAASHAMFVMDDVPGTLAPGETRLVTLTVKNLGSQSWTAAQNYRLASARGCPAAAVTNQVPMQPLPNLGYAHDPLTDVRVYLPNGAQVSHGDSTTFSFTVTAPLQPGTYPLGVRMVQEGVGFFGDTFRKTVTVAVPKASDDGGAAGNDDGSAGPADLGAGSGDDAPDAAGGSTPSHHHGCAMGGAASSDGAASLLLLCTLAFARWILQRKFRPSVPMVAVLVLASCSPGGDAARDGDAPPATISTASANGPFPNNFIFGTAIAGFQVDMGCTAIAAGQCSDMQSDWYQWITTDRILNNPLLFMSKDPPSKGPGFYQYYPQDLALATDGLDTSALRLSIEWSRIFPKATFGVNGHAALNAIASADGVAYYHRIFAAMKSRGLKPFVTVNHYTLPLWIHDGNACNQSLDSCIKSGKAGWANPNRSIIETEIAKYARFVAEEYGGEVDTWATMNEPFSAVVIAGYLISSSSRSNPPGLSGPWMNVAGAKTATIAMIEAHAKMYDAIKAGDQVDADGDGRAADVGIVYSFADVEPLTSSSGDAQSARDAKYFFTDMFMDGIVYGRIDENWDAGPGKAPVRPDVAGRVDFIGVNYYFRFAAQHSWFPPPISPFVTFNPLQGFQPVPEGIYTVLKEAQKYNLPLYVSETGTTQDNPGQGAAWMVRTLASVRQALHDGVDVRGFFAWSLMDNYEWNHGMNMRFGLYQVDTTTKQRTLRDSGQVFGQMVRAREVSPALIQKYASFTFK